MMILITFQDYSPGTSAFRRRNTGFKKMGNKKEANLLHHPFSIYYFL